MVIRHASYIAPDASEKEEGLLHTLTNVMRDDNASNLLQRRGAAALGELIFYVATGSDGDGWVLPADAINVISKTMISGKDSISQTYAMKTIENVLAQSQGAKDTVTLRLCTQEIAQRLFMTVINTSSSALNTPTRADSASSPTSPRQTEGTQGSIASAALAHLVSHLLIGGGPGSSVPDDGDVLTSLHTTPDIVYADWYKR
jgi:hypothetical protein